MLAAMAPWIEALATLSAGRAVLSLLPAGRPGGHSAAELPATASASWLLGWVLWPLPGAVGLAPLHAWLGFTAAVTIGWRIYGLGALVPRHEPLLARRGAIAWAGVGAAAGLVAVGGWKAPTAELTVLAAGLVLMEGELRRLRLAPVLGALVLALASTAAFWPELRTGAGLAAAALAATRGWLARAERRGLWISAGLAAGLAAPLVVGPAAALLVLATHSASRRRALTAALVAVAGSWILAERASGPLETSGFEVDEG